MFFQEECQIKAAKAAQKAGNVVPVTHDVATDWVRAETRRQFLRRGGNVLGTAALAMLGGDALAPLGTRPARECQAATAVPRAGPCEGTSGAWSCPP